MRSVAPRALLEEMGFNGALPFRVEKYVLYPFLCRVFPELQWGSALSGREI